MTQVGYPDWQPNVQVSDNPVVLLDTIDTANGTTHDLGDVRRFASYVISVSYGSTPAPSATNYAQIGVVFSTQPAGVKTTWLDTVELNKGVQTAFIVDGMHGSFLEVTVNMPGVAGQSVVITVLGSNRPVDRLRVMQADANDRILVAQRFTALGAGAVGTIFAPLFYGPARIKIQAGAQPCQVTLNAGTHSLFLDSIVLAAGAGIRDALLLPLRPLRIALTNTGGAAGDFDVSIWVGDN